MQIWCDIYPVIRRWRRFLPSKVYRWRIVFDTLRNKFVVLDHRDKITPYWPKTVVKAREEYWVSDIPTRRIIASNIRMIVVDAIRLVEIVGGGGGYRHVVYADGWKIAEKWYFQKWKKVRKIVPPPNPLMLSKLVNYEFMLKTDIQEVK